MSFGNGIGCTITNDSGDTAKLTHSSKTITVSDAFNYGINLTNGGGSGTSATGAFGITSTTFNIAAGGKLTLDGRYYGASGAVRTITKSTGTGTLELTGDFTTTYLQCSLSAGTLALNGTGANPRLMGLGSVGASGTLRFDSANANLFTGATSYHTNTGIRLISGLVDLNGNNVATTRIQGTSATGVVTNNGAADATLTLGNFGTTTGLATTITNPVFNGIIRDGVTNKLGLTITGGGGSLLSLTLGQTPTYTGDTLITNGATLITPGLAAASPVTVNTGGTLIIDGPLANTAGITVADGNLDIRGTFSSGALTVSGGTLKFAPSVTSALPVASLNQSGGSIKLEVNGATADKLTSSGNMTFSGGDLTAQLQSAPAGPVVLAEYGGLTGMPAVTVSPDLATTRLSSPVVDAVTGNKVTLSMSGSVADLVWTGAASLVWDLTGVNWKNGGAGSAFYNLDRVTFPDGLSGRTIDLAATVTPGKMTFTSTGTNDYTVDGVGGIAGVGEGLVKNGDAWLNLGGINTFTGPVQINSGLLKLTTPQALGFTSGVSVASDPNPALSGQLDLNGQKLVDAGRSFNATIAGDGPDGTGAIINSGASLYASGVGKSGLRRLTLSADASVGCTTATSDMDLGSGGGIDGGGFVLTKRGAGGLYLFGPLTNGSLVAAEGTTYLGSLQAAGNSLTINGGALVRTSVAGTLSVNVTLNDNGALENYLGGDTLCTGTFTLSGTPVLQTSNTSSLVIDSALNNTGGLRISAPTGSGVVQLLKNNTIGGTVAITAAARLQLGNGGTAGSVGSADVTLAGGGLTSLTINRSDDLTFSNNISGAGSFIKQGSNTVRLTGTSSYSNGTTVSAGTLLVNTVQTGAGNVGVAAGATLGGTGAMPAQVTVTGTLAPGDAGIGTFTTGAAAKTTTINGTLRIETNGAASQATDVLATAGPLTLGAASILDFDSIGAALTQPYHVIASYTGTLTGTFATTTDLPAGYKLVYGFDNGSTSTNIALVKAPYDSWIATFYPGSSDAGLIGPSADPDGDGQSNIMEFALGGIPNNGAANARIYPITADSGDGGAEKELLLTIAVRNGTPAFAGTPSPASVLDGVTCTIQGTTDLSAFGASVSVVAPVTTGLPAAPAGYEYRTFSLDGSNGLPAKGFLRVRVTQ